ncbi:MAG: hypothetical protein PHI41_08580 [Erysipelotrichaceae bacterium]|nr:hypothetical protein [Erysipelotrichaceae bacterium]
MKNDKQQKKQDKLIKKRKDKLRKTFEWLAIERIEHDQVVLKEKSKYYYVKGIRVEPRNIYMMNDIERNQLIESLTSALNRINFKFYWKFVYNTPSLDTQNDKLIKLNERYQADNHRLDYLTQLFLDFHEWYVDSFYEISFYLVVVEDEKYLEKRFDDLYKYFRNSQLVVEPMNKNDYVNMIKYDFNNDNINEYYFSRLLNYENYHFNNLNLEMPETLETI